MAVLVGVGFGWCRTAYYLGYLSSSIYKLCSVPFLVSGIRDRALRPVLGIIDPDHTKYCGPELTAYTGLDVLCHALESYTAVKYNERITGAPSNPLMRPAYQGTFSFAACAILVLLRRTCTVGGFQSTYNMLLVETNKVGWTVFIHHSSSPPGCNPISDIWSGFALQQTAKFIRRAVEDNDLVAREQMCLASTAAGVGFGT